MSNKARIHFAVALTAFVAIGGCGGGGGNGGGGYYPPIVTTPPVDPPVTQSPYDAFIAYVKALVQTAQDTSEPADITAFDPPPVSDVAEPVATQ